MAPLARPPGAAQPGGMERASQMIAVALLVVAVVAALVSLTWFGVAVLATSAPGGLPLFLVAAPAFAGVILALMAAALAMILLGQVRDARGATLVELRPPRAEGF